MMRFLSLFSGIEAASMAWLPLGWECVAVAEVDAAASAVLAYRHPSVPNLGDVTKITESTIAGLGQIDLVVFGSPCQDLSVAGKRAGLSGARSGLFHTAVGIVRWARDHGGCRFALWENVPGAFSSNQGRDFAVVVGALAGLRDVDVPANGWGSEGCALGDDGLLEWSTLDAQWFGVAQRRRRVFALADFGAWQSRRPILLEPQSLRGDSPPRREPGQGAAADVAPSLVRSGRGVDRIGETRGQDSVVAVPPEGCWWDGGQVSQTLDAVLAKGQTMPEKNRFPAVLQPVVPLQEVGKRTGVSTTDRRAGIGVGEAGDPMFTLQAGAQHGVAAFSTSGAGYWRDGVGALRARPQDSHENVTIAFNPNQEGMGLSTEFTPPIGASTGGGNQNCIAFDSRQDPVSSEHVAGALGVSQPQAQAVCVTGEVTHTLRAEGFDASEDGTGRGQPIVAALAFQDRFRGDDGRGYDRPPPLSVDQVGTLETVKPWNVAMSMAVRRLTPLECERLQGFPDQYTRIPVRRYAERRISKARPADYWEQIDGAWWLMMADGPRYKMLGNSMAVPCMSWIGRAIDAVVREVA